MSVGNAVVDVLSKKGFLNNVRKNGKYFQSKLRQLKEKHPKIIREVRGQGLLIGLVLHKNQNEFIDKLMKQKLLTVKASENVVRLLPPLNVTKKEINLALKILNNVCEHYK